MIQQQTFWSRYKVIITGGIMAIFTAVSPFLLGNSSEWDYKAIIVAGVIAAATYIGREARGKNWTMGGQVAAALIAFASAYEGDFDLTRMIIAILAAFFSVPLSPIKLSTYEKAPTIMEAKKEADRIKEVRDEQAKQSPKI